MVTVDSDREGVVTCLVDVQRHSHHPIIAISDGALDHGAVGGHPARVIRHLNRRRPVIVVDVSGLHQDYHPIV